MCMAPKTKFILLMLGMVLPYMALVMHFALRAQGGTQPFPSWFAYFGLSYILLSMIIATMIGRKMFRDSPKPPSKKTQSFLAGAARLWRLYCCWFFAL